MAELTEARLAEIEADVPIGLAHSAEYGFYVKIIYELIAAMKQAWRERDEAQGHAYDVESGEVYLKLKTRAARAEASLRQLREAAEVLMNEIDSMDTSYDDCRERLKLEAEPLRRAIDAVKDSAR